MAKRKYFALDNSKVSWEYSQMNFTKQEISWAFYDWANSSFATTVMAGFFPLFFKSYLAAGLESEESTFILGTLNSVGFLLIAMIAPVLGVISDHRYTKKRFLLFFTTLSCCAIFSISFLSRGSWELASGFYILSLIGFSGANIFYDSLLVFATSSKNLNKTSAMGYALGYLGGGLLFALNVLMVLKPKWFSLNGPIQGIKVSFAMVALWWLIFTLPILINIHEPKNRKSGTGIDNLKFGFLKLKNTLAKVAKFKSIFLFLLAYWFYIDAVDTVIIMAVDFGLSIGLKSNDLIRALLITQFVGFPATLIFGKIGDRFGLKFGIYLGILVYIFVSFCAMFMTHSSHFYLLAILIGLVQGGLQSLSRSFYAQLIPKSMAGEFFGFYNMWGKFAAVLGPFLMGLISLLTKNPRISMLALIALLFMGALLLSFVRLNKENALEPLIV